VVPSGKVFETDRNSITTFTHNLVLLHDSSFESTQHNM
jgi:hypothetical protein